MSFPLFLTPVTRERVSAAVSSEDFSLWCLVTISTWSMVFLNGVAILRPETTTMFSFEHRVALSGAVLQALLDPFSAATLETLNFVSI